MELPAEEDEAAPSEDAGEILRGVLGNGDSGTSLAFGSGAVGRRGDGAVRTRSDRARESAAGVGGGTGGGGGGGGGRLALGS